VCRDSAVAAYFVIAGFGEVGSVKGDADARGCGLCWKSEEGGSGEFVPWVDVEEWSALRWTRRDALGRTVRTDLEAMARPALVARRSDILVSRFYGLESFKVVAGCISAFAGPDHNTASPITFKTNVPCHGSAKRYSRFSTVLR
jgi:hypothetical protein